MRAPAVSRTRAPIASVLRACAAQADEQRVRAIAAVVAQQLGVLAVVGDEQIEIAVVVDVADGEPAADLLRARTPDPRVRPTSPKRRFASVAEQQLALHVRRPGAELRRVVEDVPVGDGDVELRVVVEVEERDAEADEGQRGKADAALRRRVREQARARGRGRALCISKSRLVMTRSSRPSPS